MYYEEVYHIKHIGSIKVMWYNHDNDAFCAKEGSQGMSEKIDIVLPVYNEGGNIFKNVKQVNEYLNGEGIEHNFILVNDGSSDNSWSEICRLKSELNNVTGICFSRNFGKESALCAGVTESQSDFCVVMDSDLQHPPEMIPAMLVKIREGHDIVECVKSDRGSEGLFQKVSAKLFYKLLKTVSGFDMDNSSDFKLINRRAIEAWKQVGDRNTFFRGMVEWVGFSKAQIPFAVAQRAGGESKFSTFKLIRLALSAITSFSSAPLFLTNVLAAGFSAGAVILGIQTLYNFFSGNATSGFSTVILLILILGAAILFCLGIIGTYISKIYDEVKNRPRYIIKEKV